MPPLTNSREVKLLLGIVGYYRKFVPHFAGVVRCLINLTNKDKV